MKEFFLKIWNAIKTAYQTKAWLKWVSLGVAIAITGGIVLGVVLSNPPAEAPNNNSSSQSSMQDSSSSEEEILNYMYKINVQTMDGYGLSGVTVHLYNGDTEVTSLRTNNAGSAIFMENILADLGTYTIKLTDLPAGYKLADESAVYQTAPLKGMSVNIPLMPTGVIMEQAPANKTYKLGDVMYDFSLRLSDGTTTTLSQILEEKDMVFLNFWALRCAPCKQEFPFMNLTYISFYNEEEEIKYSDKIEILALNNEDQQTNIDSYKNTNSLQFEMLNDYSSGANLSKNFNLAAIPVSAVIDRYGVIASLHTGGLTSITQFQALFNPFIGEDYSPIILREDAELPGGDGGEEDIRIKPTVSNPSESDIQTALGNSNFEYFWDKDEYAWPWLVGEENGEKYIYSSNKGIDNSYSILYATFTANANTALCFDMKMQSEVYGVGLDGDFFHVFIDGVPVHSISGLYMEWNTFCAYVFKDYEAGEHELAIIYQKDSGTSAGEDVVQLKNIRFESVDTLNGDKNVDSYIIRQAATQKNLDANATTQFKSYVTAVYNEMDGYYHAYSADGPVLYANVLGSTSFSDYSIYDLASNGYCVSEGFDLYDDVNTMAWESTYNYTYYGFTPVTQKWKSLLDELVYCTTYTQKWGGEYHENEWLELCVYYEHFGDTPVHEDPLKGVTYNAAFPIGEGTTKVNVPFEMVPRGFKYKFVPTKSGVYNIYSTSDSDTICYLAGAEIADIPISVIYESESKNYLLGEYSSSIFSNDGDFNFHYYFEEGKTYYLQLCYFSPTETGSYDVTIDFVSETYQYLAPTGTTISFSLSEDGTFYVLDGVNFAYSETDGYYHVKNGDGSLGSIIYLDTARDFWYSDGNWSLTDVAAGSVTNFRLTVDEKDYTEDVQALVAQGAANTEMEGFVAVDKNIFDLLVTLTQAQYEPVDNDWLLMCYYWKQLG